MQRKLSESIQTCFDVNGGGPLNAESFQMTSSPSDNHSVIDWPSELHKHRDWMHGVAKSRLSDADAADDVLQDVSLAVIRQNGRPTNPEKIRAWLYRIVVRRAADHLREQYRHNEVIADFVHEAPSETVAEERHGHDWVLEDDPSRLLQAALKRIPEDDRRLFEWKYGENWSYRQLAEQFGMSERAVEYRLVCARQRLRKEMQALRNSGAST